METDIVGNTSGYVVEHGRNTTKVAQHIQNRVKISLVVDSFARYEVKRGLEEVSFYDLRFATIICNILTIDIFLTDPSWAHENVEEAKIFLFDQDGES